VRNNVADKRCDNGHFIDESWDICPYCPPEKGDAEINVVRPNRFDPTSNQRPPSTSPDFTRSPSAERRSVVAPAPSIVRPLGPAPVPAPAPDPVERTMAVQKPDIQGKRYVVGWLVGLNGTARGESYPIRMGRNILGRDRKSDISVNDDQASSHHADLVFRPEERRFILMDHNSTNGTYVNEHEIEPRRDLAREDVIRIGAHRFLFMPLCQDGFYWDDEGALQ
jgi:hypothetical protein